jgi:hypothetical protein
MENDRVSSSSSSESLSSHPISRKASVTNWRWGSR